MKKLLVAALALVFGFPALIFAADWESSPDNWKNSENNWENSESNWKNSKDNWKNSPDNYGNKRIIRDNKGKAEGYEVPKRSGGSNFYDLDGKRKGYTP